MEHLLLLLGTGSSSPETLGERAYRTATYFLPGEPEAGPVETPFVGEAILDLHPGRFDRVHLLGTASAMWDTLYEHTLPPAYTGAQEERWFALHEAVEGQTLSEGSELLGWIEKRFSEHVGVETGCHLLPPGSREEEFWEMLDVMSGLNARNGCVSLDITHGLRAQPIFLLLSLFYLRSAYEDVSMGSVFYGAYELADSHFGGQAPVYDLRPMVELMDWIEAARVFDRYGDAAPIADLLRQAPASSGEGAGGNSHGLDALAGQMEDASRMLQVNVISNLRSEMHRLDEALGQASGPPQLDLMRPRLRDLPRTLASAERDWEALRQLARRHWEHYQAGLAVMAAWEAVVARMARIYQRDDATEARVHNALGHAVSDYSGKLIEDVYRPGGMARFPRRADELRRMRNSIAHVERGGEVSPQQVYGQFPGLLRFFEEHLGSPSLGELPKHRELQFR
jgi:CRISPR-associated Csx2 family protein